MPEISWTQPAGPPYPPPVIEFFYLNPDRPTHPSHVRWENGQFPPMILEVDWRFWRQPFDQLWRGDDYLRFQARQESFEMIMTGDFDRYTLVQLREMSDQIKKLDG